MAWTSGFVPALQRKSIYAINVVPKLNYGVVQDVKQFVVVVGVVEARCLLAERKVSWENLQ
jgi:hypothetical protein